MVFFMGEALLITTTLVPLQCSKNARLGTLQHLMFSRTCTSMTGTVRFVSPLPHICRGRLVRQEFMCEGGAKKNFWGGIICIRNKTRASLCRLREAHWETALGYHGGHALLQQGTDAMIATLSLAAGKAGAFQRRKEKAAGWTDRPRSRWLDIHHPAIEYDERDMRFLEEGVLLFRTSERYGAADILNRQ